MKFFTWFKTNRALRLRIIALKAEIEFTRIQADVNRQQATRVLHDQRAEIAHMAKALHEAGIRNHQLHNAAETLAKHTNHTPEAGRARAHWQSIR